jgi:hypothetical protein
MSLINDALKRAQRTHQQQPRDPGTDPPLQPVDSHSPRQWDWAKLVVPGALVLVCAFALGFLWLGWRTAQNKAGAQAQLSAQQPEKHVVTPQARTAVPGLGVLAPAETGGAVASALTIRGPLTEPVTATKAAALEAGAPIIKQPLASKNQEEMVMTEPEQTEGAAEDASGEDFKLQAIYYRLSRPSAMVDGRALGVGDEIRGAKVLAIERYSVSLLVGGQTNVLRLR